MRRVAVFLILLFVLSASPAQALDPHIIVGAWNVESGDSDPELLAEQLASMTKKHGIGLWGLSEVLNESWVEMFEKGLERATRRNYGTVFGTTGRADKLAILYDRTQYRVTDAMELHFVGTDRLRAPLAIQAFDRKSKTEFLFVVNHLYRGKKKPSSKRNEQAAKLRKWATHKPLPIISVGDFNFDCEIPSLTKCDEAFDIMTEGGVYQWVRPTKAIRTQCNRRYNLILDFIFVANDAKGWVGKSQILHQDYSYCDDDERKADHRPVLGTFIVRR